MAYKDELDKKRDYLKGKKRKETEYFSRRAMVNRLKRFPDTPLSIDDDASMKNRLVRENVTYGQREEYLVLALAKADKQFRVENYSEAFYNLGKAYKDAKALPEELRDKYFDAIERRAVRYANKSGDVNDRRVSDFLSEMDKERMVKSSKLEKNVGAAAAIIGILGGLIFLSPNLTGNVVGGMENSTSNIIGGISFIFGLIFAYIFFDRE